MGRVLEWKSEIARVRYATSAAANLRIVLLYFPSGFLKLTPLNTHIVFDTFVSIFHKKH